MSDESDLHRIREQLQTRTPAAVWAEVRQTFHQGERSFDRDLRAFKECFGENVLTARPTVPAWTPAPEMIEHANVTNACAELGLADYDALHRWSVASREAYWSYVLRRLSIPLRKDADRLLDASSPTAPVWFPGARMNIVESCFAAGDETTAIVYSDGTDSLQTTTVGALRNLVGQIACSLTVTGIQPGDRIGVILPMTPMAVAIYLGIIAAGATVVCIPESFAAPEMEVRLRVADVALVITQDVLARGAKILPLYERVCAARPPSAIVIGHAGPLAVSLREGDGEWSAFLGADNSFEPVERSPQDPICILFSSGTTGDPKAIPWDHTTPIKCAADGHFHQDIHDGDVVCWPTSLGWMMGPWLIFASLMNRATIALFGPSPLDAGFGKFVQNAHVTMLGTVPAMMRAWRYSTSMEPFDWSHIRSFSATGECSNATDILYLMYLANYKPVIEYCGGTEIGGAYITGVVVKPCIPATFNTPALGIDFDILDDARRPRDVGEVFLKGPSIGLSTRLLNRDHDATYFAGTGYDVHGWPYRRHGDELAALPEGYFQALGRCDDTMNLNGIKVGCVEIELVVGRLDGVMETAAVAITDHAGGPSRLAIFVVLRPGADISADDLKEQMQQEIKNRLNPLFHIDAARIVASLPRTASNKILRRPLREQVPPG